MKKNNIKNFIIAIVTVLIVGLIITGSTFAYFQWTTADDQRTNVNVVIESGGIEMVISPETTVYTGLRPVGSSNCHTSSAVGKTTITIKNKTGTLAIPSFKLKAKVVDKNGNGVPESALEHIHYSVVKGNITSETVGYDDCFRGTMLYKHHYSTPLFNLENFEDLDELVGAIGSAGTLSGVSENAEWSILPGNGFLPREFYVNSDGTNITSGITFIGDKKQPDEDVTETTETFSVVVWIDSDYVATNVGNVVSDPLQDAKIYVTWSEESMIQQVAGGVIQPDAYVDGVWEWNDTLNSTASITSVDVNFTYELNGDIKTSTSIGVPFGTCFLEYSDDYGFYCMNEFYEFSWYDGSGKIIDFGSTPQVVSREFYDYLNANAVKQ